MWWFGKKAKAEREGTIRKLVELTAHVGNEPLHLVLTDDPSPDSTYSGDVRSRAIRIPWVQSLTHVVAAIQKRLSRDANALESLAKQVGELEADALPKRLNIQARQLDHLEEVLRAICPHEQVKYVKHFGARGWVRATFECVLCHRLFGYEAGPGSDDDMPPRFRDLLTVGGVEVPLKESKQK